MSDDEEYVFEGYDDEDAYGGDDDAGEGGGGAEAGGDEAAAADDLENMYAMSKYEMTSNPARSEAGFNNVIEKDSACDKWTWKSYKMLARLLQQQSRFTEMIEMFDKLVTFQWSGRNVLVVDKAVSKFIERCSQANVPSNVMEKVCSLVIDKYTEASTSVLFGVKLRLASLFVEEKDYSKAEESYAQILRMLTNSKDAFRRNSAYIVTLHAAQIELYSQLDMEDKLGECYEKAMVLLSGGTEVISRVGGVVHLCGGKLYMANGEYENARVEFNRAFESFVDERQIESLKYLVVATILSKHEINPFDGQDARRFREHPDVYPVAEVIEATATHDMRRFEAALSAPSSRAAIYGDKFLLQFIEPLINRFRDAALLQLCLPYTSLRLSFIAKKLQVSESEAERMCSVALMEGRLQGLLDDTRRILLLAGAGGADSDRHAAIAKWGVDFNQRLAMSKASLKSAMALS